MKRSSIKKVSVLGLVLVAASAVTAAIIPSKNEPNRMLANNGTLSASAEGQQSCKPTAVTFKTCIDTASNGVDSNSTGVGFNSLENATTGNNN